MKKVLGWFDYVCSTGFGQVSKNIIRRLDDTGKYEFDIVGINFDGCAYDQDEWRGHVSPALVALNNKYNRDLHGRQHLIDRLAAAGDYYDIVFIIQDTFIVETLIDPLRECIAAKKKQPKIIFYYPIDAPPKPSWVNAVAKTDFPVAYTHYAKAECLGQDPSLDKKIQVIYHGHDFANLYPLDENLQQFRNEYFMNHLKEDTFLILNVNRNQSRKDIIRSFMILDELKRRGRKNIHLYMHMAQLDVGGDLQEMASNFGLAFGDDWSCPADFNPQIGITPEMLNKLYNTADCFLSTTMGEGFGLTICEAAATKCPIVAPANTCLPELYADNRAYLIPSGETPSAWVMKENDNERLRPLMNVEDAATAIEKIIDGNPPDVEGAYSWIRQLDWDHICKQWEQLFDSVEAVELAQAMPSSNRAERRRMEREMKKQQKKAMKKQKNGANQPIIYA